MDSKLMAVMVACLKVASASHAYASAEPSSGSVKTVEHP